MDLKIVVENHPECLTNRSRLAAVLRDLYPNERLLVNIALEVYECGIADRLRSMTNVEATQTQAFCHQLATEYALPVQVALQGLEMWADAYGVSIKKELITATPIDITNVSAQQNSTIISNDPFAHTGIVEGNPLEYEVKEVGPNQVAIARFLGFEKQNTVIPNRIDGKNVVNIGGFSQCSKIETIIISDGIECIRQEAFRDCKNLKNIKMNTSLKSVYTFAFFNTKIERICFPKSTETLSDLSLVTNKYGKKLTAYFYLGTKAIGDAREHNFPIENAEDWPGYN